MANALILIDIRYNISRYMRTFINFNTLLDSGFDSLSEESDYLARYVTLVSQD